MSWPSWIVLAPDTARSLHAGTPSTIRAAQAMPGHGRPDQGVLQRTRAPGGGEPVDEHDDLAGGAGRRQGVGSAPQGGVAAAHAGRRPAGRPRGSDPHPEAAEGLLREVIRPDLYDQFQKINEADFAHSRPGVGRFRVNAFRQRGSVGMVLRRVQEGAMSIAELGLPPVIARLAEQPRGLLLVTGPTGSGKTTTLAAMIDHVNANRAVHIVTIEDPIEVLHADKLGMVNQREVRVDTSDFTIAMRAAMRQDPDVILVGEIRDSETLKNALAAAETGHLVLSTLHTTDAAETVNRCIDLFS